MLGWVVLGKTPRSLPGPRGYNSVNYHLIYYGKRGNLWHGECMRSTECLLVTFVLVEISDFSKRSHHFSRKRKRWHNMTWPRDKRSRSNAVLKPSAGCVAWVGVKQQLVMPELVQNNNSLCVSWCKTTTRYVWVGAKQQLVMRELV